MNAVLGTDLDDEDVWASLAPLGIELDDDAVDDRPRHASSRSCRRSAPTSTARSTWSRRWRAASASTASAARCPTPTARSACSRVRQQERRLVADALVGVGLSEAITLPLVSPGRPRARPARRSTGSCAPPTRCGPRSRCCAPRSCPGCCARSPATGRTGSPTSRCSRWAACSYAARPRRAATIRCPTSPSTSRWRGPASVRRRPVEDDRAVDVYDARRRGAPSCSTRSAIARRRASSRRRSPATAPGRAARVLVDGHDAGTVGEVAPEVLDALGLDGPGRRGRARARHPARRRAARPHVPRAVALPRVDHRPRVRASTTPSPRPTSCATIRRAGRRRCSRTSARSTCSASDALGAGRRSLAFALRFRAPDRTLTDAEVGTLRQQAIDAVVAAHGAELRG